MLSIYKLFYKHELLFVCFYLYKQLTWDIEIINVNIYHISYTHHIYLYKYINTEF